MKIGQNHLNQIMKIKADKSVDLNDLGIILMRTMAGKPSKNLHSRGTKKLGSILALKRLSSVIQTVAQIYKFKFS